MLVYGYDAQVAEWVSIKLGGVYFENCKAIGIVADNELIAGVVYNNYHEQPKMIEASIASINPKWATREHLKGLFAYPFEQLEVVRLQASCSRKNKRIKRFLARLGFVFEGYARAAHHTGGDAAVFSMLKHECKWI